MTWTNTITTGSFGGAKTREPWPANGSGQAGRVEIMDRPKQDEKAEVWLVNRCNCGSANLRIYDTKKSRPREGCTTRYLLCRECGRRWTAVEWPR